MGKRFTDTAKWFNNKWFFGLSLESKLFWIYLLDNCDSVGVWEENILLSNQIIGYTYSMDTLLKDFKKQIFIFKDNRKWWIKDFCDFQYGILSEKSPSKPIQSYIALLKKHGLWKEYLKGIHTLKEKKKETDEDNILIKDLINTEDLYEKLTYSFWMLFLKNMERFGVNSTDLSKAKIKNWLPPIRQMIETDQRSESDISLIYSFLKTEEIKDGFAWAMNIRSTEKLRENFEKILIKAKNRTDRKQVYDIDEILKGISK